MREPIIIDLEDQAEEVARYTKNWSSEQLLEWMRKYGDVSKLNNPFDDKLYFFRAHNGRITGFRIDNEGNLIIIRDHSTYNPK